jgi:hypothetical protein
VLEHRVKASTNWPHIHTHTLRVELDGINIPEPNRLLAAGQFERMGIALDSSSSPNKQHNLRMFLGRCCLPCACRVLH